MGICTYEGTHVSVYEHIYFLLHYACYTGTMSLLSINLLGHFTLAVAGLTRFLEGALEITRMNAFIKYIISACFYIYKCLQVCTHIIDTSFMLHENVASGTSIRFKSSDVCLGQISYLIRLCLFR